MASVQRQPIYNGNLGESPQRRDFSFMEKPPADHAGALVQTPLGQLSHRAPQEVMSRHVMFNLLKTHIIYTYISMVSYETTEHLYSCL